MTIAAPSQKSITLYKSDYVSDTLTKEDRSWLEDMYDCKRTDYYDLSEEEVDKVNEFTRENLELVLEVLDFNACSERVGLLLTEKEFIPVLGDDGEPLVNEEGKPEGAYKFGEHKFKCDVVVEGLVDSAGTPIPKGKSVGFTFTRENTNRPLVESNWKGNVLPRLHKWMLNGETMIKDILGLGISEQHTCVARLVQILTGKVEPEDTRMMKLAVSGIHPLASITADTGKANTGKDIFGSDPEIVPVNILVTAKSRLNPDDKIEYVPDPISTRTKVCGQTESVAKMLLLRMGGKNINASLGNGQKATMDAHILTTRILPDLDELVAASEAFIGAMSFKERPCTAPEVATALACYFLSDANEINTIPRSGRDDLGIPLDEASSIRFDVGQAYPFLAEMKDSGTHGRLADFQSFRINEGRKRDKKEQKFGQLLRAVQLFHEGEDITAETVSASTKGIGKQTATKYVHCGGADRGPVPKKEKGGDSDD